MAPAQVQGDLAFSDAGLAGFWLDRQHQFGVEHFQRTATEHGQCPVRRHTANRLVVFKVIAEFGHISVVLVFAGGQLAFEQALVPQPFAQGLHE